MMKKVQIAVASVACVSALLAATSAQATFHLWDIVEAFSNADGSVQFVEMFDVSNFENAVGGMQLKSNANTFTIPANLPTTATANHHLLFATADFDALTGGVTPDYTIPANFFDPAGDTLNFASVSNVPFASAPTDGIMSIVFPAGTTAVNSPTNFAGMAGSVDLSVSELFPGDYSQNGRLDAADYTVWRDAMTAGTSLPNDPTPGVVNESDFEYWRRTSAKRRAAAPEPPARPLQRPCPSPRRSSWRLLRDCHSGPAGDVAGERLRHAKLPAPTLRGAISSCARSPTDRENPAAGPLRRPARPPRRSCRARATPA